MNTQKQLVLLVAVISTAILTHAQAPPGGFPPIQSPTPSRSGANAQGEPEPRFNLRFDGGKASNLVQAIEIETGRRPSVIIAPNASDVVFPAFELRNVGLTDLFAALNALSQDNGWFWHQTSRGQGLESPSVWVLIRQPQQTVRYGAPVAQSQHMPERANAAVVQIFHVGGLLEKFKIEDLTTAIETGWQMAAGARDNEQPAGAEPDLKFHGDTQLLLVRGNPSQLTLVREVLAQLQIAVPQAPKPGGGRPEDPTIRPLPKAAPVPKL